MAVAHKLGDAAVVRKVFADADHELTYDCGRELLKRLEGWPGAATLHPGGGHIRGPGDGLAYLTVT